MPTPKITIITATYNSGKTVEDTLKSVAGQKYPNIEHIVVDGKSRDDTLDIVNKHGAKIARVLSEKDRGIFDAFNKGIRLATGEIIGILNSDDFYVDNTVLEQVVKAFEDPGVDAVYGDLVFVDAEDTRKVTRYWKSHAFSRAQLKRGWMPPHPTFFVRRQLYDQHGVFNLDMKIASDYELLIRLLYKFNVHCAYLPRILVKMRGGGQSNGSLSKLLMAAREDMQAWRMNGLSVSPLCAVFKRLRKLRQLKVPSWVRQEMSRTW